MRDARSTLILLAAGQSRRFGGDKRQAQLTDGTPLLVQCLRLHLNLFRSIILVLRPEDQNSVLEQALPNPASLHTVYAPAAAEGMGHSLASAATYLTEQGAAVNPFIVALADMPFVASTTLRALDTKLQQLSAQPAIGQYPIVQPRHNNQPGNPVGFHGYYARQLSSAAGDRGARDLLARSAALITYLDVDDPGILRDIDRPSDLAINHSS